MAANGHGDGDGDSWRPPPSKSDEREREREREHEKEKEKRWISGLLSGAGRLISAVFAAAAAASSDSEEDDDDLDDAQAQPPLRTQDMPPPAITTTTAPPPPHGNEGMQSNSKFALHHLITTQSFSSQESDNLINLIQSRVFQPTSPHNQQIHICNHNIDHTPYSSLHPSPQICTAAVAEAKKWFHDKNKTASSTSKAAGLAPCKLSTDMSHFEIESDIGSPVDLAKSYMLSKPPWQSPFLTTPTTLFSTPLSGPTKFTSDAIHGTFDHSLSSSRFLKRDYISTGLWDPKEESSRRVRSRLSGSAFDSISSFIRPNSSSRLHDRDILESENNLNSSLIEGKEPSNPDVDVPSLQAGTDQMVNASEPTLGNNAPLRCVEEQRNADVTTDISVDLNKAIEGIPEMVILEMSTATVPALSGKNNAADQDQKILTDDQAALEGNKGPKESENNSEPQPHEGDLHITNSLHGSTNKNSADGPAVQSNMESEFESSINGEPTSSTAGPDISEDKSLNGSGIHTGTKNSEPGTSPIRKGRKRVVSGRGRGRGRGT